jgi:hypothetical protein
VGTYAAAVAGPATPQPQPWYRRRGPFTAVLSVATASCWRCSWSICSSSTGSGRRSAPCSSPGSSTPG